MNQTMILTMTLRMMTKKMGRSFSRNFYLLSTNPIPNPPKPRSTTPRFTMATTKQSYAPSSYNVYLTSKTTPKPLLQARQKFNMPSLTSLVLRSNTSNQQSLAKLLPSLYGLQIGTASVTNSKRTLVLSTTQPKPRSNWKKLL